MLLLIFNILKSMEYDRNKNYLNLSWIFPAFITFKNNKIQEDYNWRSTWSHLADKQ